MEMELEPRVKPLPYKIKAMSRESTAAKGANLLDPDLRTHWSTGTNTKEWILLELDESCLLSHMRIYNKSVLEWEITVGLRYRPEAFVKVRPRCEAPKRDMIYATNYTPCRYVRLSCLRGNPIAVFFIQLIGVPVKGLELEFQPVINFLLPHIISHKHDAHDMHLQLLRDMAGRLLVFLPQLETELSAFTDASDSNIRFLAMLAGPFYPILQIVNEREAVRGSVISSDTDISRNNEPYSITVSSNFEPRRLHSQSMFIQPASSSIAFRPDAAILLLRRAYKNVPLGIVCCTAARALQKIIGPIMSIEDSKTICDITLASISDETAVTGMPTHADVADYSSLFGEEFKIPSDNWNVEFLNVLDIAAVQEGILHVLYACATYPLLCSKLADHNSEFWSVLPLIQALLPALRPFNFLERVEFFLHWKHPSVEQALSQIAIMSSSSTYSPLLRACAGYLSSFSLSHTKTACVLIDLCTGSFSQWIPTVTAKVDLAIELMEDLLGIIQGPHHCILRALAALNYVILGLSGHIDDILAKYKEHKHKLLFLIEMLEPFLDPALAAVNSTANFGDVSDIFLGKQENNCSFALNIIRTAVRRPTVLPSLESEWRLGSVASSVLLSVLGPNMPLPSNIDLCKCSTGEIAMMGSPKGPSGFSLSANVSVKFSSISEVDGKIDASDSSVKFDVLEEANFLFAPKELKETGLTGFPNHPMGCNNGISLEPIYCRKESKHLTNWTLMDDFRLDSGFFIDYLNLNADYLKLSNLRDCELRAAEFQYLAQDLCSKNDVTAEGHDAAIDAFLLAAECYINPFFMMSFMPNSELVSHLNVIKSKMNNGNNIMELRRDFLKIEADLEVVSYLERKRDKAVLEILLQAAKFNKEYRLIQSEKGQVDIEHKELDINMLPLDTKSADAVTLARQNQALLFEFVIQQLQKEQQLAHEVLLQALLFLLHSATELLCPPESVVDIILQSAENFSLLLMSIYNQLKDGNQHFALEKLHGLQRHWSLLERLVIASSGSDNGRFFRNNTNKCQCRCLIPPSSWMSKIPKFSKASPLSRFIGWMAVSLYAKQYLKERLFFASDLSQLRLLFSIFSDELAVVDITLEIKAEASSNFQQCDASRYLQIERESETSDALEQEDSFRVVYPSLQKFFPNLKKQFGTFGERILEAVGLQLKYIPPSAVPEMLCWFSDLCMWPYAVTKEMQNLSSPSSYTCLKGYASTNAKVVVLYILEAIVTEHMESMFPEMPRVAQIFISLCKTSYSDVAFLDSVLCLLRPLISYFLKKATSNERLLDNSSSCQDFEFLTFEVLFDSISQMTESQNVSGVYKFQGSLMIFILGSLFPDFSFKRKMDILQSLLQWADFSSLEPTSSFYNYLCAFKKVFDSCEMLLQKYLEQFGLAISCEGQELVGSHEMVSIHEKADQSSGSAGSGDEIITAKPRKDYHSSETIVILSDEEFYESIEEMKELSEGLELLGLRLVPAIEKCWKLHHILANKLTVKIAQCFLLSNCMKFVYPSVTLANDSNARSNPFSSTSDLPEVWKNGLQGFTKTILVIQENECWQIASSMLDYLFSLRQNVSLDYGIFNICSAIKLFCLHAPMISWRLQTDKWLTCLFVRGMGYIELLEDSLVDVFCTMLSHAEPEQRAVALHHLGVIVGLDAYDGKTILSCTFRQTLAGSEPTVSLPESAISSLVSNTWDRVAALTSSDSSLILRSHAMMLLSGYIPFAKRTQLQSFLVSANKILQGMGKLSPLMEEGHLTRISLGVLASACVYSPAEDIALIPESVWRNLERMATSRTGWFDDMEKSVCIALCKLRTEFVGGKEALKEVLSSASDAKLGDPNFRSIRESILQVLPSLTSIKAYFDFFSRRADQVSQELEEAEIERDLLQKERVAKDVFGNSEDEIAYDKKDYSRLQQIKDDIRSLERSKLTEEVAARRQKKLVMRHYRQKFLEEVASREMELLQELDRERTSELEREIERQRQLELERAKTRELQFNLDMERERQSQRELQRELEHVESGVRSSRREISSNPNSRPREKYRERDNGRPAFDVVLRPGSRGHDSGSTMQTTGSSFSVSNTPTIVLSSSRSFSGELPTILQPRDRSVEHSTVYEDNLEVNRDSGDANSIGDPELSSALEGLAGGFAPVPRRGSSKSRQIPERREREGRREGKWERKHF